MFGIGNTPVDLWETMEVQVFLSVPMTVIQFYTKNMPSVKLIEMAIFVVYEKEITTLYKKLLVYQKTSDMISDIEKVFPFLMLKIGV